MRMRAIIFDLDGVLTDTAEYHYQAWKVLCDEAGLRFDRVMNEQLKGVSRRRSLDIILHENNRTADFTEAEKEEMIANKNEVYVELLKTLTSEDILPGIIELLEDARREGVKLAVASASKNAGLVLEQIGLTEQFDYIADAAAIKHTKPDPEVFLNCAEFLGIDTAHCVGIEDSQAGIEAIHAAGMFSVGIGEAFETAVPDLIYRDTGALMFTKLADSIHGFRQKKQ